MEDEQTVKEHYQENIRACFEPDIDNKVAVVALLENDTVKLDAIRAYMLECDTQEQAALEAIDPYDREEDILPIVGVLESVPRDY